mmetsp:Transcript_16099/g.27201  ORF Transcript_16099/g.27201 Transcript_16099/m.27201 type:complete len:349 (+) Transcript_16099:603-1649(+)
MRYGGTSATQSRGFASYFVQLCLACGLILPTWMNEMKLGYGFKGSPIAVLFLIMCTMIQTRGSKSAGDFNNVVTSLKLVILMFIIVVSFSQFDSRNFEPFLNEEKGVVGLIEGITILFFGYLGFDFITTISEEAKNPIRDIPIAIQLSVIISMLIYALVAFSVNGVASLAGGGDGETALAQIFTDRGMYWMSNIIFVCALLGITAAAFTNLMSQSRILYSFAKDGLFFKVFQEIDPKRNVPVKGSWLSIIPIAIFAFFMNLSMLAKLCSLCNLMTYAFINLGVIVLRLKNINTKSDLREDIMLEHDGVSEIGRTMIHTHQKSRVEALLIRYTPWVFFFFAFASAVSLG